MNVNFFVNIPCAVVTTELYTVYIRAGGRYEKIFDDYLSCVYGVFCGMLRQTGTGYSCNATDRNASSG